MRADKSFMISFLYGRDGRTAPARKKSQATDFIAPHVDAYREYDDGADDDVLGRSRHRIKIESILHYGDCERPEQRRDDIAAAARKACPADDGGGDGLQFEADAVVG